MHKILEQQCEKEHYLEDDLQAVEDNSTTIIQVHELSKPVPVVGPSGNLAAVSNLCEMRNMPKELRSALVNDKAFTEMG